MSESALFVILFIIPLAIVWGFVVVDLVRRTDIKAGKKILWGGVVVLLVEIGALAYLLARPLRYPGNRADDRTGSGSASAFVAAAESHRRGELDDSDMTALKTVLMTSLGERI
ncbi:MAG: PLDc N-terminal domain-containing protein [Acidimicrobiia bacterium]